MSMERPAFRSILNEVLGVLPHIGVSHNIIVLQLASLLGFDEGAVCVCLILNASMLLQGVVVNQIINASLSSNLILCILDTCCKGISHVLLAHALGKLMWD